MKSVNKGVDVASATAELKLATATARTAATFDTSLKTTIRTDNSTYVQGGIIRISGSARNIRGELVNIEEETVYFAANNSQKFSFSKKVVVDKNGAFTYDWPITYGDALGSWQIKGGL